MSNDEISLFDFHSTILQFLLFNLRVHIYRIRLYSESDNGYRNLIHFHFRNHFAVIRDSRKRGEEDTRSTSLDTGFEDREGARTGRHFASTHSFYRRALYRSIMLGLPGCAYINNNCRTNNKAGGTTLDSPKLLVPLPEPAAFYCLRSSTAEMAAVGPPRPSRWRINDHTVPRLRLSPTGPFRYSRQTKSIHSNYIFSTKSDTLAIVSIFLVARNCRSTASIRCSRSQSVCFRLLLLLLALVPHSHYYFFRCPLLLLLLLLLDAIAAR